MMIMEGNYGWGIAYSKEGGLLKKKGMWGVRRNGDMTCWEISVLPDDAVLSNFILPPVNRTPTNF